MNMAMTATSFSHALRSSRHWVVRAVTYAFFGNDLLGELERRSSRTLQDHGLDAVIVIQMCVHGRDGHIVMVVLHAHQAPRQFALLMVIDVTEHPDAVFGVARSQPVLHQFPTHQITKTPRIDSYSHGPEPGDRRCRLEHRRRKPLIGASLVLLRHWIVTRNEPDNDLDSRMMIK